MLNLILWLIFGAAAGAIAGWILKDKRGLLGDIIVGILGSFLAGWAGSGFSDFTTTDLSWTGFFTSILGAVVLIVLLNFIRKR
ncbi:GlsB/YeaQ/YmgE family stress response membrane protein [Acholeplasma equirhinis]|uniref:GlsB/YeaQ/YmgE family stress response membrane protein n=1 Tax=Acholeplasma equirhinis TaxID=555393 RepID=UPI00197AF76A|nr:GlsB/YeaQ/YmgE family stress response membrane protein [Acholeplasma equirhinis]MBN3490611.1 GlsB/YeaQ/YmgE family stress response membrane protein [Acholeplasma equirhinis]